MPRVAAVDVRFPAQYHRQDVVLEKFLRVAGNRGDATPERIERIFANVGVRGRHMVLDLDHYPRLGGFAERSHIWLHHALDLGTAAVSGALERAGVGVDDVSLFASTTVTGIAVPSLESRIMSRLGFDPSCRRLPLFGLGCVAGASGIARVAEYLRARPRDVAILLSVELCSLTFQLADASVANIVACALFGDAAACVVLVGDEHPLATRMHGPSILESRAVLFPDSERVMGWDIVDSGFRVVLSGSVPDMARGPFSAALRAFLDDRHARPEDVEHWIAHPGGPAVIDAIESSLGLGHGALDASRACLREVGNLSSASVLVILRDVLARQPRVEGSGMLFAMGPGFAAELVALQW
jgi:alkylresorcinol/alkylpyrone synthase